MSAARSGDGRPGTITYGQDEGDLIAGYARDPSLHWAIIATEGAGVALASVRTQQTVGIVTCLPAPWCWPASCCSWPCA